jgi:4-amino-4-deoxy-L-arabinose transferase-like glycosyltransferase
VRDRLYFILMGICLTCVIVAWTVVRQFSVAAAVAMSGVALFIPPVAAIIANAGDESSRRR